MLLNKLSLPALSVIMAVAGLTGCGEGSVQTSSQTTSGITASAPPDNTPLNWPVPQFKAIDENGQSFDSSMLGGHVWIVDVFYSTCPTVCPPIASNMAHLQQQFKQGGVDVQIVSLSVDPQNETPTGLKKFGLEHGADFSNWHFLTGYSYQWIQQFSLQTLKAPVSKTQDTQIYSHTINWYLVDKSGKIVSLFDGLQPPYDKIVQSVKSLQ